MTRYEIQGWYSINNTETQVQEIRSYEAKNDEEAIILARKDGLKRAIFLEIPLGEPELCCLQTPPKVIDCKEKQTPLLEDKL